MLLENSSENEGRGLDPASSLLTVPEEKWLQSSFNMSTHNIRTTTQLHPEARRRGWPAPLSDPDGTGATLKGQTVKRPLNLNGTVTVQLADDDLWLAEPFSRGQAWLDLWLLANDEARQTSRRGIALLKRGQLGRGVAGLAERWQWSRIKARAGLEELRRQRKITFKMDHVASVITVLDYELFNPEAMANQTVALTLDRQTADDDLWLAEPFSRGQAWLDLWLLANDAARQTSWRGITVPLKRGQLGRSVASLATRWQWSRIKTRAVLEELRRRQKINFKMDNVATVITVLDYERFNPEAMANQTANQTANLTADLTADLTANQQAGDSKTYRKLYTEEEKGIGKGNLEKEIGIGNERNRKGEASPLTNVVGIKVAIAWCRENHLGYTDDEVTAAWNGLTAVAVNGLWTVGGRTVTDWRCALADECGKRRLIYGKKNSAHVAEREPGEPPPPPGPKKRLNLNTLEVEEVYE